MKKNAIGAWWCPIIFGIILIMIGLIMPIPGGALTTYSSFDGESADTEYYVYNRYSAIDEYVGGDAYNYIIGASLIAGRMSGMIAAKAICIVGGILCLCVGLTLSILKNERKANVPENSNSVPLSNPAQPVQDLASQIS